MVDLSQFRLKTERRLGSPFGIERGTGLFATPFARAKIGALEGLKDDSATEVSLRSRTAKNVAPISSITGEEDSTSGISAMLKEIRNRSNRIEKLQSAREKSALGSTLYNSFTDEIAAEEAALNGIVESSPFKKMQEVLSQVESSFAAGASSLQIAGSLSGDSALLGNGFISRVGSGDTASLSLFSGFVGSIVTAIKAGGERDDSFFSAIDTAVSGALKTLQGRPLESQSASAVGGNLQDRVAPLPTFAQIRFAASDGLALSIQGYVGSDAVQAAMAHMDYDPKKALVLLAPVEEDPEEEKKSEEKDQREREDRLAASQRTSIESD